MDLSALIFVAVAVAWAVYLIPMALKHHDEVVRSRSVEKFSHTMRVLARREPVDRRNARLVVSPIRAALRPPVETKKHVEPEPVVAVTPVAPQVARPGDLRASARRAAARRRRVLSLVLLANVVVIALASFAVITWPWVAAPAAVLVAWLVACRLSVRAERAQRDAVGRSAIEVGAPPLVEEPFPEQGDLEVTGEISVTPEAPQVPAEAHDETPSVDSPAPVPGAWDMVPTTLPTYVGKPVAQRRTVSTIDLDSTGVWSSGRNDEDSALARSAEQSARSAKAAREDDESRRASGA